MIASGSEDKTVRLWNPTSGKLLRTLQGHRWGAHRLLWSPDGTFLGWGVRKLLWSPDGSFLASVSEGDSLDARVWNAEKGDLISSFPGRPLYWSADGKVLATSASHRGPVRFWDVALGSPLRSVSKLHWADAPNEQIRVDGEYGNLGIALLKRLGSEKVVAVFLPLRGGKGLLISPEGHYRGTPGIEEEIVYVAQTDQGQETLTPEEFARKYGWKNDPERVRIAAKP
jgi:WD40 repeat protein